jgi:hypothetical protein
MKGYVFTARLLPIEQAEQIKRWYSQR